MTAEVIDYSRKWQIMATVGISIFLTLLDTYIVNVALPTLTSEFRTDFATVQWVVLAYLLTLTTLLLTFGRLGDMIGKKPVYLVGLLIFTIGSVLCGLAPTVGWLIVFRVAQALGGSILFALSTAIITEAFPASERGKAMGVAGLIIALGVITGPVLGGILIDVLSWPWIFFINVPIGVVGLITAVQFIPAIKPEGKQQFDYPGALTLFASLFSLLLALTLGQRLGFTEGRVLLLFAGWMVFFVAFLAVEWRSPQPMVDLRLFGNSLFTISVISGFLTFVCLAGTIILLPFYLENVLGYSTRQMSFLLAVVPIGLGIVSPVAGSLSDRFGTRPLALLGLVVMLIGYLCISLLDTETSALSFILLLLPMPVGIGLFQSPNNSAIMGTVSPEQLGLASGFLSMSRTLGQTAGTAVLGALWAGRVFFHNGEIAIGGATSASAAAQVAGLHDTMVVVMVLLLFGVVINIFGLAQERRDKAATALSYRQKKMGRKSMSVPIRVDKN